MGRQVSPQKCSLPWGISGPLSNTWFLGATGVSLPNGILISSAILHNSPVCHTDTLMHFGRGSGCEVLWWVRLCVCVFVIVCVCLSDCLCVCVSARIWNLTRDLYWIFVHVAYGRGSVKLRSRCDTLCTFGFVDDIVFSFYNGPYRGMNFAAKNRFRSNLLIYLKVGQNSISYY